MPVVDQIFDLFRRQGHLKYGEDVSQLTHALQAAHFAREQNATPSEVVATLLHDIGHLWESDSKGAASLGYDARHEDLGDQFLRRHFSKAITEPVRLHVAAKRYLCAIDPTYSPTLTRASLESLALQGGPMSVKEVEEFRSNPHYKSAVRLRKWDDLGKEPDLEVAKLESYRELVESYVID